MKKNEIVKLLVDAGIEANEAKIEVEYILEKKLNKTREELVLSEEFEEALFIDAVNERINTKKPIQYILGTANFMGEKFIVTNDVLIPRDETEILVREAYKKFFNGARVLDIGTGSGIIPCMMAKLALAENKDIEAIGVDISLQALNVAIDNMKKLNLTRKAMFRKSDLFSNIHTDEKFDIIISNPPYIPKRLYENIQSEVKFEPYNALFTEDEDGLYFYKKITDKAPLYLNNNGYIFFEVMEGQAKSVTELLLNKGFVETGSTKDLAGIERVVFGKINT